MRRLDRQQLLSLLAAALLAQGSLAFACRYCHLPPPPRDAPRPEDPRAPFRLSGDVELTERELSGILSNPRYRRIGDHIEDAKEPDRERHLLRPAPVMELLRELSHDSVDELRRRVSPDKPLAREEFLLASHLYWDRGPLLSQRDRRDLKAWISRRLGAVEDIQPPSAAPAAARAGGAAPAPAPLDPAFRRQVIDLMRYTGTEEEGRALVQIMDKMLESPTARSLLRQWVEQGHTVTFRFETMDNSHLQEEHGRRTFTGTRGYTVTSNSPMEVVLNRFFLQTSPDHVDAASCMAHELLGHAVRNRQAQEKGLTAAFSRYINDETNARLVGWAVKGELGGKLEDGYMWDYLASPAQYYDHIGTGSTYYSGTLSLADMQDPVAVFRRRLGQVAEKKRSYASWKTQLEEDRRTIDHFTGPAHRMDARRFRRLTQETDNRIQSIPTWIREWGEIEDHLNSLIAHFRSQTGQNEIAEMQRQADDPFFERLETDMAGLRRTVARLAEGRTYEGETGSAPEPGQVTRAELRRMRDEDKRSHPEHWP